MCCIPAAVILLPLGVLSINPIWSKYGSTTSSSVASSSQRVAAIVPSPTGPELNL